MKAPHSWIKLKGLAWPVCKCCGLIWLKNDLTAQAVRAGCE